MLSKDVGSGSSTCCGLGYDLAFFIGELRVLLLRLIGLVVLLVGDDAFVGDYSPCTGEDSTPKQLLIVFCTAIWSVSFLNGSRLLSLLSSSGVYYSRNSSIER